MPTPLLAEFGHTRAWETRMRAIGHGRRSEMSTADALDIAEARDAADRRYWPIPTIRTAASPATGSR